MFIFSVTRPTPVDVPDKPPREEENWDDQGEEIADKDKALKEEQKGQKGKYKVATTEGVFKAPKTQKTMSSKPPSPIVSEKASNKPKKRKTKVNSFIIYSINQIFLS